MTNEPSSPSSYPPGYDPYGAGPPSGGRPETSGLAVAGLVVGLAGFCVPILGGLVGLVLSIVALRRIGRSGGTIGGRGLAIGGIVASAITLLYGLILATVLVGAGLLVQDRVAVMRAEFENATTRQAFEATAGALEMYNLDMGHYPTEAEGGLEALRQKPPGTGDTWNGPYIQHAPTDPWGHPLRYDPPDPDRPDTLRGHTYRIWSVGPDGAGGTADDVER